MSDYDVLSSDEVFSGGFLRVWRDRVRLPNGHVADLELVPHHRAAAILPLHADHRVTLVRQFRYAVRDWIIEIPAGLCETGEEPRDAAARELAEEVGLRANRWDSLGAMLPTPGFCGEKVNLFLARGLSEVPTALEPGESLEPFLVDFAEAVAMAQSGEIADAKSTCALLRAAALLKTT